MPALLFELDADLISLAVAKGPTTISIQKSTLHRSVKGEVYEFVSNL
jgi:hypothetical protein